MPEATVGVVAPAYIAGIEVQVPREARIFRIEGRRPVVAAGAHIAETGVVPEASGGEEDTVAVGGRHQPSVYSVLRSPRPSTVGSQLRPFRIRRHPPGAAPAAGANPSAQPAPDFNFGWKFHFGPCEAAQEPAFDDAGWRTVDLQYIRVYAVDRKGNVVPDYCGKVHIDLKGGGSLLSLDNGDHYTNELSLGVTDKAMKDGFIMAVLRSSRTPGPVTVSFSSGRIQKTLTLDCR